MNSVEDVMLDLAWRRFSDLWHDKRDIETKASILLTASGILLGLLVNAINSLNPALTFLASLFLFLSLICCVLTLRPRVYNTFDLEDTWNKLKDENALSDIESLKLRLYGALSTKEKENARNIDDASKYLVRATYSFLAGCLFVLIDISLFFF